MKFFQAGFAFALFGWISLGLQAGWVTPAGPAGLVPQALASIGTFKTATILFFVGAASASWFLLRQDRT